MPQAFISKRAPTYQDIPNEKWDDWRWQLSNRLNNAEDIEKVLTLTESEKKALNTSGLFRVDVTPYYISLIDPLDPEDPIRKQIIPRAEEMQAFTAMMEDSLAEDRHSPVPGLFFRPLALGDGAHHRNHEIRLSRSQGTQTNFDRECRSIFPSMCPLNCSHPSRFHLIVNRVDYFRRKDGLNVRRGKAHEFIFAIAKVLACLPIAVPNSPCRRLQDVDCLAGAFDVGLQLLLTQTESRISPLTLGDVQHGSDHRNEIALIIIVTMKG